MIQHGDYGLFDTVLAGPAAATYGVAWALLAFTTAVRGFNMSLKLATGQDPEIGRFIYDLIFAAGGLALYSVICSNIWAFGQNLAFAIYPDSKMEALGTLLNQVSARFRDYSFSFLDVAKGAKDGAVVAVSFLSWIFALLGHEQLQGLQANFWNILYCFGPLLLAASMLGIPSARVWFSCLIQVSVWSVAVAVVYLTIGDSLTHYLEQARDLPLLDTQFISVINYLLCFAMLPVFVPAIVAFFVGQSTLPIFSAAGAAPVFSGLMAYLGSRFGASPPPPSAQGAVGDRPSHHRDEHQDRRPKDI